MKYNNIKLCFKAEPNRRFFSFDSLIQCSNDIYKKPFNKNLNEQKDDRKITFFNGVSLTRVDTNLFFQKSDSKLSKRYESYSSVPCLVFGTFEKDEYNDIKTFKLKNINPINGEVVSLDFNRKDFDINNLPKINDHLFNGNIKDSFTNLDKQFSCNMKENMLEISNNSEDLAEEYISMYCYPAKHNDEMSKKILEDKKDDFDKLMSDAPEIVKNKVEDELKEFNYLKEKYAPIQVEEDFQTLVN